MIERGTPRNVGFAIDEGAAGLSAIGGVTFRELSVSRVTSGDPRIVTVQAQPLSCGPGGTQALTDGREPFYVSFPEGTGGDDVDNPDDCRIPDATRTIANLPDPLPVGPMAHQFGDGGSIVAAETIGGVFADGVTSGGPASRDTSCNLAVLTAGHTWASGGRPLSGSRDGRCWAGSRVALFRCAGLPPLAGALALPSNGRWSLPPQALRWRVTMQGRGRARAPDLPPVPVSKPR